MTDNPNKKSLWDKIHIDPAMLLILLAAAWSALSWTTPLALSIVSTAVLMAVGIWETWRLRGAAAPV